MEPEADFRCDIQSKWEDVPKRTSVLLGRHKLRQGRSHVTCRLRQLVSFLKTLKHITQQSNLHGHFLLKTLILSDRQRQSWWWPLQSTVPYCHVATSAGRVRSLFQILVSDALFSVQKWSMVCWHHIFSREPHYSFSDVSVSKYLGIVTPYFSEDKGNVMATSLGIVELPEKI